MIVIFKKNFKCAGTIRIWAKLFEGLNFEYLFDDIFQNVY